jgi:tetratricopeptide (TPR) repeat protein
MTNIKDLITEAKRFYENKNFAKAKSHLLTVLKNKQIEKNIKLSIYILISDVCYKINDFDNAEKYLVKCIDNGRESSEIYNSLGNIYIKKGDFEKSEKSYLRSIDINEDNETVLINLAILYHNLGKKDQAISFYKKVLKLNPDNMGVLFNLSKIDPLIINQKLIQSLKKEILKKSLGNFNLASCYFLLANYEKRKKNFSKEMDLLKEGNIFSFNSNEKKNLQLNNYWLNSVPKKITDIKFHIDKKFSNNVKNIHPIFIIGLPRCGSTLLESIISSGDDKVENLGETNLVNWAFLNTNQNFIDSFSSEKKMDIDLNITAQKLINVLKNLRKKNGSKKKIFLEKSLENFYYIELILNIFPNAKFIHSQRNLTDNIFAIYNQFLPNISWSHSIKDILLYINNYVLILDHFKKKYPSKIFSISLENFTIDPEKISKEIYNFCNLNWSRDCLKFYKRNDLFINTASNNQMRKNISKYDDNKYAPYKKILSEYLGEYDWLNQ